MEETQVTVVADGLTRRRALERALEGDEAIAVVPSHGIGAGAGAAAVLMAAAERADRRRAVVVIDLSRSDAGQTLALVESIATPLGSPGVVVVGAVGAVAVQALLRGAAGVVASDPTPGELREAVKAVARGEAAVPPDVATALVARLRRLDPDG